MNFTLTRKLSFSQAAEILLSQYERTQAKLYRKLMKRLKVVMKKPLVKTLFKLNNALEKILKITMQCAHCVEKTWFFKASGWLANALILSVRKDGLKFIILLTSLGYSAWCYFI